MKVWIFVAIPLLIGLAYLTLAERKFMAGVQRRRGPNVVGVFGLLQPLADGLKLFVKETLMPSNADFALFLFAPLLTFFCGLIGWAALSYGPNKNVADIDLGLLYILAVSSCAVYGIVVAGWASNSKYAFLGSLRSTAQMVAYEVSLGIVIANVALCAQSFSCRVIVEKQQALWFCVPLFPLFCIFFLSGLAETNRHPFDLPEAEAELVSGYNVEYSSLTFALFFLGEYANILFFSALCAVLFWGGWLSPVQSLSFLPASLVFSLKICIFASLFVLMRAALPRYRYDQLMDLGWLVFLPFACAHFCFLGGVAWLLGGPLV